MRLRGWCGSLACRVGPQALVDAAAHAARQFGGEGLSAKPVNR
jgi:hypothetical protein